MNLLEEEVVAIVGPQTSVVSHFVSHMGTATRVPLVSFSATDPSLSEDQYPYFVRLTHGDNVQMAAIAGTLNATNPQTAARNGTRLGLQAHDLLGR